MYLPFINGVYKMSLLKNWKLLLAALAVAMFTACAGSSGGSSSDYSASEGGSASEASSEQAKPKPKPAVSEAQVKKAEKDAMSSTEENHKLRKEIFEAKTKLGMSADEEVPVE